MYKFESDDINKGGKISITEVLRFVSQEQIFEFAFGFQIDFNEFYTSPFRKDNNPGCFFDWYKGRLFFIDFATSKIVKKINLRRVDCFAAVQLLHKLPNFISTLHYIYAKLCLGKVNTSKKERPTVIKKKSVITPFSRSFIKADKDFWSPYYITKEQLIQDKVIPLKAYNLYSTKSRISSFVLREIAYCYSDFPINKKIYFPKRKKNQGPRFISTTDQNDIGGINTLPVIGDKLVITKSYKDWRVLKNNNIDSVWFQGEGLIPETLPQLLKRFDETIIWFDNDKEGIKYSQELFELCVSLELSTIREIRVPVIKPSIKDPSDFIKHNIVDFKRFINTFL